MITNFNNKILVNSNAWGIQIKRCTHHGNVSTGFISERVPTSTINSKQRTYVSRVNFIYILKKEKVYYLDNTERYITNYTWF